MRSQRRKKSRAARIRSLDPPKTTRSRVTGSAKRARRSQVVNEPKSPAIRTGTAIERETRRRRRSGIRRVSEVAIVARIAKRIRIRIRKGKGIDMVIRREKGKRIRTDMESQRSDVIRNGMARRRGTAIGNVKRTRRGGVIRVASIGSRPRERMARIRTGIRTGIRIRIRKGRRGVKNGIREGEVLMRRPKSQSLLWPRLRLKSRMRMTMMMVRMRAIRVESVQLRPRVHDRTLSARKIRQRRLDRDKRNNLTSK